MASTNQAVESKPVPTRSPELVLASVIFFTCLLSWVPALLVTSGSGGDSPVLTAQGVSGLIYMPVLGVIGFSQGTGWSRLAHAALLVGAGVAGMLVTSLVVEVLDFLMLASNVSDFVLALVVSPIFVVPVMGAYELQTRGFNRRAWVATLAFGVAAFVFYWVVR